MSDREYIERCIKQIEEKYNLGGGTPMERDYEYLREVILKATRTDLSTSTLRRLWLGKYQAMPQINTLDALAQVLDYSGWHEYKNEVTIPYKKGHKNRKPLLYIAVIGAFAVATAILLTSTNKAIGPVDLEPEAFEHEGVPAMIGFKYSVQDEGVEIELSWNPYERTKLHADKDFYTGTYYYPDYHHAKLIYNNQILTQKSIHITTRGWHGLVMDSGMDTRPQYVDSNDFMFESKLSLSKDVIENFVDGAANGVYSVFTFSNKELEKIYGDKFSLITTVKMEALSETSDPCGIYEILIKGEDGNMRIPIVQTGCYGLVTLRCAEQIISGKQNDLSNLSTNLKLEHQVEITNSDKVLEIVVGDNPPFHLKYESQIGALKVIKFIFTGAAEVSSFLLLNDEGDLLRTEALYPF